MKKNSILIALALFSASGTWAGELPKDTLKVIDVEEIVVIAAPKENRKLRELPTAVTMLSQQDMQANQVNSIKSLTALVPNIFIPDYGSRLTSAIYIRGIGSRINTPSVGLYVDNVPYIDKSAFDFNYADLERIDVLRGPQGTLYGRNTMGGLIKVHTKSPFSYQGTDLRLGAGSYNNYNASVTHYHRVSDQFAFSTGGFYEYGGGFFKNTYLNKRIDKSQAAGGRFRGIYLPGENLKLDLNISYEYSHEGGYPYFYTGRVDPAEREDDPRKERREHLPPRAAECGSQHRIPGAEVHPERRNRIPEPERPHVSRPGLHGEEPVQPDSEAEAEHPLGGSDAEIETGKQLAMDYGRLRFLSVAEHGRTGDI